MKKAEISALGVGRFYPQGGFMLLISVRGWVHRSDIVWSGGISQ
jgi:hypothetical protein